jgi:hypothetical protein
MANEVAKIPRKTKLFRVTIYEKPTKYMTIWIRGITKMGKLKKRFKKEGIWYSFATIGE